jgi:amino acid transporter
LCCRFFWCIPVSLVSAELTAAMPVEGGFYRWTRAAFGDFWGFLAGWWNWSASFLLGGAYAVLFTDYLFSRERQDGSTTGLRGADRRDHLGQRARHPDGGKGRDCARDFHLCSGDDDDRDGADALASQSICPADSTAPAHIQIFGVGLALGLWLYSGYEQLSTVAEEVENPQRAYPRALALVVPLSIAAYFLPTLAGLASAGEWQNWHTGFSRTRQE